MDAASAFENALRPVLTAKDRTQTEVAPKNEIPRPLDNRDATASESAASENDNPHENQSPGQATLDGSVETAREANTGEPVGLGSEGQQGFADATKPGELLTVDGSSAQTESLTRSIRPRIPATYRIRRLVFRSSPPPTTKPFCVWFASSGCAAEPRVGTAVRFFCRTKQPRCPDRRRPNDVGCRVA